MNKRLYSVFLISLTIFASIIVNSKNNLDIYDYNIDRYEFDFEIDTERYIYYFSDEYIIYKIKSELDELYITYLDSNDRYLIKDNVKILNVFNKDNTLYLQYTIDNFDNNIAEYDTLNNYISYIELDELNKGIYEENLILKEIDMPRILASEMFSISENIYIHKKSEYGSESIYKVYSDVIEEIYKFKDGYSTHYIYSNKSNETMYLGRINDTIRSVFIFDDNGLVDTFTMNEKFANLHENIVENGMYVVGQKLINDNEGNLIIENTHENYIFFTPFKDTKSYLELPFEYTDKIIPIDKNVAIILTRSGVGKYIYLVDINNNKIIYNKVKLPLDSMETNLFFGVSGARIVQKDNDRASIVIYSTTEDYYFEVNFN